MEIREYRSSITEVMLLIDRLNRGGKLVPAQCVHQDGYFYRNLTEKIDSFSIQELYKK